MKPEYKRDVFYGAVSTHYDEYQRIFTGRQRYLIRLFRPRFSGPGDWMLLYDSDLRAVVGEFNLYGPVERMDLSQVRRDGILEAAGMTQKELEMYAGHRGWVSVMEVGDVIRYSWPMAVSRIWDFMPDFEPPRVFSYISDWLRPDDIDYIARMG